MLTLKIVSSNHGFVLFVLVIVSHLVLKCFAMLAKADADMVLSILWSLVPLMTLRGWGF